MMVDEKPILDQLLWMKRQFLIDPSADYFDVLCCGCSKINTTDWLGFKDRYEYSANIIESKNREYYVTRDSNHENIEFALNAIKSKDGLQPINRFHTLAIIIAQAIFRSAKDWCSPSTDDCTGTCEFAKAADTGEMLVYCGAVTAIYKFPSGEHVPNIRIDFRLTWDDVCRLRGLYRTPRTRPPC
jgi:hypothetical protein